MHLLDLSSFFTNIEIFYKQQKEDGSNEMVNVNARKVTDIDDIFDDL